MTSAVAMLVLFLLAAACFAAATLWTALARPALVPLGLLLATLAGVVAVWP